MMRWTAALLALLLMPLAATGAQTPDWKLVSERDGIQVYMAHSEDSRIKTFRGVMEVEIEDFYSMPALADDYEYFSRWLYLISELGEVKRRSPVDRDVFVRTRLPWPVADRDAGLNMQISQDPKTMEVRYELKGRPGIIPATAGYVRIPEMYGHFNLLPIGGKKVRIDFQVLLDPGGYIPAFLANFILKDIPFVSLQRFRRVINTERFRNHKVDYLVPPEGWRK